MRGVVDADSGFGEPARGNAQPQGPNARHSKRMAHSSDGVLMRAVGVGRCGVDESGFVFLRQLKVSVAMRIQ